ncbi:Acetyltransferase (GNAT) domain-containing protein [Lachnospiraceae bacterium RM5]|nr:Acetyltransferase (GNAT) domain-containing protein [Lachnospiraceae bacterium RM5]
MIILKENDLCVKDYLKLREKVKFKDLSNEQAETALKNSLYIVSAYEDDKLVGMGRIVGDGVVIDYIQDLIVIPGMQGRGIGRKIIEKLIDYVMTTKLEDTEIMLCLMCAKGREEFYKKFDFIARPTEKLGPGMIRYIK